MRFALLGVHLPFHSSVGRPLLASSLTLLGLACGGGDSTGPGGQGPPGDPPPASISSIMPGPGLPPPPPSDVVLTPPASTPPPTDPIPSTPTSVVLTDDQLASGALSADVLNAIGGAFSPDSGPSLVVGRLTGYTADGLQISSTPRRHPGRHRRSQ